MNAFEQRPEYQFGKIGESEIANWLKWKSRVSILPVYDMEIETGKGPRIFTATGQLVAPDMQVLPGGGRPFSWVEAKHKTRWSWYRRRGKWQTGIDAHHYADYLKVRADYARPVWLLFLQRTDVPDERDRQADPRCPATCPTGLFGGEIEELAEKVDHPSDRHGRYGMVYWNHSDLTPWATLEEIDRANRELRLTA